MSLNLWLLQMLNMAPREPKEPNRPKEPGKAPNINHIERFMPSDNHKQKTVRVRIAVAVMDDGKWYAVGDHSYTDKQSSTSALRNTAIYTDKNRIIHFVEADVPVPESYTIKAER